MCQKLNLAGKELKNSEWPPTRVHVIRIRTLAKRQWALMQYRIHVDISTSTRPTCTKITGNTYQPISNHSRKFELNRISGSVEFDVDCDVVVLNNNSLFDLTSSRPICTKITGNTYQLISNHSRKFELNQISGSVEFDVDFVALYNNSLFDSTSSGPICTKITENI